MILYLAMVLELTSFVIFPVQVLERALKAVHTKFPSRLVIVNLSGRIHTGDTEALRCAAKQVIACSSR